MEKLEKIRKEVDSLADRLGKPIESGIKELVIGLRFQGIETEQSCEGHLDRASPYPWVRVPYKGTERVANLVAMQNRPKLSDGSDNVNAWVIRPSGAGLRIMPEDRNAPLEELQRRATEFGFFLQHLN